MKGKDLFVVSLFFGGGGIWGWEGAGCQVTDNVAYQYTTSRDVHV